MRQNFSLFLLLTFSPLIIAEQNTPPIELYVRDGCPYCERVELSLISAGLTYKKHTASLHSKEDWMYAKTPNQTYPMMKVGEHVVFESLAQLDYVSQLQQRNHCSKEQDKREPNLLSSCVLGEQAQQKAWGNWLSQFQNQLGQLYAARDRFDLAKFIAGLESELSKVESMISEEGYLNGPNLSYGDVVIAPVFYRLKTLNELTSLHLFAHKPRLKRWYQTVLADPALQKIYDEKWRENFLRSLAHTPGFLAGLVGQD